MFFWGFGETVDGAVVGIMMFRSVMVSFLMGFWRERGRGEKSLFWSLELRGKRMSSLGRWLL